MIKNFLKSKIFFWIFFVIIALLVFSPSLAGYFVSDDWDWLTAAHAARSFIPNLFANSVGGHDGGSYNPVASLWFNLLYRIFGLTAWPYHFFSILLHATNAAVIVFLYERLCRFLLGEENRQASLPPVLAGLIFLILPVQSEAVSWLSAVPHLLATLFIVIALTTYLGWRLEKRKFSLVLALFAAACAYMSKESAIILPFFIALIELSRLWFIKKRPSLQPFTAAFGFFILVLLFLLMRFAATGLFVGTYAEASIIWRPRTWIFTFLTFFEEFFTGGLLRIAWSSAFWNSAFVSLIIVVPLLACIVYFLYTKHRVLLTLTALICIAMLPYVTLGFNRTSADGERYTYLPAVFFVMVISAFIFQLKSKFVRNLILIVIIVAASAVVYTKNTNWQLAGELSKKMIVQFSGIARASNPGTYYFLIGTPDTVKGAHIFRNNFNEAIRLVQPETNYEIKQIPVYVQLNSENYNQPILDWNEDDRGWLASSTSGSNIITGTDRVQTPDYTYELWGYNYNSFSSPQVRLILSSALLGKAQDGSARFIVWNAGRLQLLTRSQKPPAVL